MIKVVELFMVKPEVLFQFAQYALGDGKGKWLVTDNDMGVVYGRYLDKNDAIAHMNRLTKQDWIDNMTDDEVLAYADQLFNKIDKIGERLMKTKAGEAKYRVTHYDPVRWVYEFTTHLEDNLKDAKARAKELLEKYPLSSQGNLKIEKVQELYTTKGN